MQYQRNKKNFIGVCKARAEHTKSIEAKQTKNLGKILVPRAAINIPNKHCMSNYSQSQTFEGLSSGVTNQERSTDCIRRGRTPVCRLQKQPCFICLILMADKNHFGLPEYNKLNTIKSFFKQGGDTEGLESRTRQLNTLSPTMLNLKGRRPDRFEFEQLN